MAATLNKIFCKAKNDQTSLVLFNDVCNSSHSLGKKIKRIENTSEVSMSKLINNHLRNGYSDYNLMFLKRYIDTLDSTNTILDVGCGHYRNLYLFYKIGFKNLYGIDKLIADPSDKPKRFKVNFINRDITYGLPYENKQFDVVLCNFVLMFIPLDKLEMVIEDILRVTKGYLIIETQKQFYKGNKSEIEDYRFGDIKKIIEKNTEFEILDFKSYKEKLILRRTEYGKREKVESS
ncbi:class I SAM-dependent methyltransferase [Clostridium chrysemydis]|uniref:class I SAM-dependent methyltransferase n=1 Tax=Clostridium chrysemydis TaxID=2665504 RepID=UPI001883BB9F|nr:class I SAM-dependent methyltransferase [Clostridium chrysemydis]